MSIIILALLGAFLWRLRGGLLNDLTGKANWLGIFNDTTVRVIWAVGMDWGFWLTHYGYHWIAEGWFVTHGAPVWIGGGLTGSALFAGTTVIGWFGAALYPTRLRDVALLSLSGLLRMSFLAVVLASPWPMVAGFLFGPAYWIGAKLPHPKPWMFWGEVITGAIIGACLAMV